MVGSDACQPSVQSLLLHAHFPTDTFEACCVCRSDEEIVGDMWWGENEWTMTRAWLRHELEEEGDAMLLEQLRELEEWAVKASARALAAASRGTTEEQSGSGVGSIRAEIEALYEKHNPSKIATVSARVQFIRVSAIKYCD